MPALSFLRPESYCHYACTLSKLNNQHMNARIAVTIIIKKRIRIVYLSWSNYYCRTEKCFSYIIHVKQS